jgi:hypothetical protein
MGLNRVVGRLCRPGEDFVEGPQLVADLVLTQVLAETIPPEFEQLSGRFTAGGNHQRCGVFQ